MNDGLRVAIVSHGHPEFSSGGAENASYSLFRRLKDWPGVTPTYLARCFPRQLGHAGAFGLFRGRTDEVLWCPPPTDRFRLVTKSPAELREQASQFCARMAPQLIHLHHYIGFGTDLIRIFKKELRLPVVLTLHEYVAICYRDGQMLKTSSQLCYAEAPAECSLCFPDRSPGKFFFRKALIMENFSYVDLFVAPSAFLAQRYVEWGLDAARVRVIDNPAPKHCAEAGQRRLFEGDSKGGTVRKRLAYFGRFTPNKGIDVLIEAVASLEEELREQLQVFLFGFQPDHSGTELQRRIAASIDELKGCIIPRGPYRHDDVIELMRSVDWVVVPSIWWENSPVVIREAKMAGVPVLCSNIGGMREKVRPGIDGAHFRVSDSADLADRIRAICAGELIIHVPPSAEEDTATEELIAAYRALRAGGGREVAGAEPLPLSAG